MASRLMQGQLVIVAVGVISFAVTTAALAPRIFLQHLEEAGATDTDLRQHAQEAFDAAFLLAVSIALVASLVAAVLLSWLLARRVGRPLGGIASAAHAVAAGHYAVEMPGVTFSREIGDLATSFRRMADQLADTDSARARVMADLAHEIRTPLATLEAQMDGMEDGVIEAGPAAFEAMHMQVARLRRLATDLRDVAAAQEGRLNLSLEPVRVGNLLSLAVAGAGARYAANRVNLTVGQGAGMGSEVLADAGRMQQVLANLLDNALRHTPPGGTVTVDAARNRREVLIDVTDTGSGISADQLALIFERFHRADPSRAHAAGEGSGLGLNIARAIVNGHGGTLTASSAGMGRGSTFTISLPRL